MQLLRGGLRENSRRIVGADFAIPYTARPGPDVPLVQEQLDGRQPWTAAKTFHIQQVICTSFTVTSASTVVISHSRIKAAGPQ